MASNHINSNDVNAMVTNGHSPLNEENGKSRKRKPGKLGKDKKPKKPKPSNKRRNIKKLLDNKCLNESTLIALKEEQERKQRLNGINQLSLSVTAEPEQSQPPEVAIPQTLTIITRIDQDGNNLTDICSTMSSSISSRSGLLDDDTDSGSSSCGTDDSAGDEDDDLICLDDPPSELKANSQNIKNRQTANDETLDDSDDCQILNDDEVLQVKTKTKHSGMHMDDDLNRPNADGTVLINLNHPPNDANVYLEQSLAKFIKPHQIGGIRFMYDNIVESLDRCQIKNTGFGCILAHSMGLGKTFQVICFIEIFLRCTSGKRVLCIVPINTIQNWLAEFNTWLPEHADHYKRPFGVYILNDNSKTFAQRATIILNWRDNGGVLLIGYEMFRTFISLKAYRQPKSGNNKAFFDIQEEDQKNFMQMEIYNALLEPSLVVCDEGHRVKNSSANIAKTLKSIKTKRRIVLTGYPLQNNLIEYWCMVDFVRPSYLGTKAEFTNMFERPILNGQCMDSTLEDVRLMRHRAHVLHTLLEGFVQRRSHDVLYDSLPPKEEFIILVKLSSIQKELYLAFMESIGAMNFTEKPNPLRTFAMCCKIWNHPDVLYDYIQNKEIDIDLDLPDMQQQAPLLNQKSKNHFNTCSVANYDDEQRTAQDGFSPFSAYQNKVYNDDWAHQYMGAYLPGILHNGSKFAIAFTIIEESVRSGDKVLLFSQSLLTLNLIERFLSATNVPNTDEKWNKNKNFFRLDGSTNSSERERLISSFNVKNNGIWLFLLSTRAGCLGINLIGANRVIVLDASFNPCHDAQAVCRVYRYGQPKPSFIYRLISDHTMEKRIYDRQVNKQTMSDRVVDEIQTENNLTRFEIEKLIHYVKEDVPCADLSNIKSKFNDHVLLNSCCQHQSLTTKEPFRHESLFLEKKEYKLTSREKRAAFQDYEYEKTCTANFGRQSYSAHYRQFYQHNNTSFPYNNASEYGTKASHSAHSKPFSSNEIYSIYKNGNLHHMPHSSSMVNMCSSVHSQNENRSVDHRLVGNLSTNSNTLDESRSSSDIEIIEQPPKRTENEEALRQIGIRRIVTTTAITIPASTTVTNSLPTVIPPGENVILLHTPKGEYLRLPDGRFFAIRNQNDTRNATGSTAAIMENQNTKPMSTTPELNQSIFSSGLMQPSLAMETVPNSIFSNPKVNNSNSNNSNVSDTVDKNNASVDFFNELEDDMFAMSNGNLFERTSL